MCAGMFLVLLDVTIVNVALPSIRSDLHTSLSGQQWVVDGYAVVIAGLLLGGGTIGDRIGHRKVVVVGLGLFGVASAVCGLAPDIAALVGARGVQGAGAALLLPGSLAVIADAYPGREEQARALGIWAAVSSLALPAGPLVGGLLVTNVGWRSVFLINVPVVVAAAAAVWALVPHHGGRNRGRLDVPGLITAPITLAASVFAVISAERSGIGTTTVAAIAVALVFGIAFVTCERRVENPMFPLSLLRRRTFVGANSVALLMNLSYNGTIFVTTLNLQSVHHYSAMAAGASLIPVALPLAVLAPVAGWLTARFGPRPPMAAGIVLCAAAALCMLRIHAGSPYTAFLPVLLGLGLGCGLLVTADVAAAIRSVPADKSGLASGVNNTMRQTGTALGVAVFGAIVGSPEHGASFITGWHHLAWVVFGLWCAALLLTLFATVSVSREARTS